MHPGFRTPTLRLRQSVPAEPAAQHDEQHALEASFSTARSEQSSAGLRRAAAAAADGDGGDGVDAAAEFGDAEEGAFATAPASDFSGGGAFADFA